MIYDNVFGLERRAPETTDERRKLRRFATYIRLACYPRGEGKERFLSLIQLSSVYLDLNIGYQTVVLNVNGTRMEIFALWGQFALPIYFQRLSNYESRPPQLLGPHHFL